LSKSGVKLGLAHGSALPDPHGLLEGKGKVHRYVQLQNVSDLGRKPIRELVKTAHGAWKTRSSR
jgi:hypothetical protein